jgi:hypothetical protein
MGKKETLPAYSRKGAFPVRFCGNFSGFAAFHAAKIFSARLRVRRAAKAA